MDLQTVFLDDCSKLVNKSNFGLNDEIGLYDIYKNCYGAIRRDNVKFYFDFGHTSLPDVEDLFIKWMEDPEYFILKGNKPYFVPRVTIEDHDLYFVPEDGKVCSDVVYKFIKASKRGNDVYKYLIGEKLKILDDLKDITFFNKHAVDKRSSLLFITLTYDNKRCSVKTAWENIGTDFHGFINNLRKQFGHIEFFRTWESTEHYYPHVHCLIGFTEQSFPIFTHNDKDGKTSYRIPNKVKNKIASYWHSFVDVQGVDSSGGAVKELTKYVTKDLCSKKGYRTNSMIWLFRKQSFAISKGFVGMIEGNMGRIVKIEDVRTTDLIKREMCNCNLADVKWEFVGVLRGCHLGFNGNLWVVDYEDPPPHIKDLIDFEERRQVVLNAIRSRKRDK